MKKTVEQDSTTKTAMDIEPNSKFIGEVTSVKQAKPAKKDLLRFENPIYDVFSKDKYADEKEFMIKKLMQQRKKPKFELLPQSTLLQEVKSFIPLLKQANKKAAQSNVDVQIDKDLHEQQSSSEEDSENSTENPLGKVGEESNDTKMPIQDVHSHESTQKQIELNFLVAKYPNEEEHPMNTTHEQ